MEPIKSVVDIEPLISFYIGLLGEKPGRLMVALSFLADLEYTEDWRNVSPEVRLSIELAKTLTADVFKQMMAEQENNSSSDNLAAEIEALFKPRPDGRHGE
jgi:hypothetical protein